MYGGSSAAVEESSMTGMHLRGEAAGLLSGMMGEADSRILSSSTSAILPKWSIGIGQRGRGARILGGRCSSGMP